MRKLLLALVVGFGATLSLADTVTLELNNGARLVGTIIKEENGKIYFHADLVGDVEIELASVKSRTVDQTTPEVEAPSLPRATPIVPALETAMTSAPKEGEKEAAKAPEKKGVTWKGMLSLNGSYNSATFEQGRITGIPANSPIQTGAQAGLQGQQSTLQVTAMILALTPTQALSLVGSYGYADYQPAGAVMNNHSAELTYEYFDTPGTFVFVRSTYKVDHVSLIDHSLEQILGYGWKIVNTSRTKFELVPGFSLVNVRDGSLYDDEWILSAGILENFQYAFNPRVSLKQRFKYREGLTHSQVWDISSYLGLSFPIAEHLSFEMGATYNYDNTLGPLPATIAKGFESAGLPASVVSQLRPEKKDQLLITSGLELTW